MFSLCCFSLDPGSASDCDSDPGCHISSRSGADDSRWYGDSPGGPAEDHPATGGDRSRLTPDPDTTSTQPSPAARCNHYCRVPGAAVCSATAGLQGSGSPGGHQSQNPCQAQWGKQLGDTH